jgi:predicted O-methyltransferase YrrM
MAPGALLAIDHLLAGGDVDAAPPVARELMTSPHWRFSVLPVGDGVGLGARRATVAA